MKLKTKIEDVERRINMISTDANAYEHSEERILQILNFSGYSGLTQLRRIGEAKAKKIMAERENGYFQSIDDLARIGMKKPAIDLFRQENQITTQ